MSDTTDTNITMTYSSFLMKDGKKAICVRFERETETGVDYAEAMLPNHTIVKQKGFTEDEIAQLEFYLKVNKEDIHKNSREITGFMNWFK